MFIILCFSRHSLESKPFLNAFENSLNLLAALRSLSVNAAKPLAPAFTPGVNIRLITPATVAITFLMPSKANLPAPRTLTKLFIIASMAV